MVLAAHIIIALTSIVFTTFTYVSPSKQRLSIAKILMVSTLLSGTYLVISAKSPLLSACITGLAYTAIVSVGIFAARYKLTASEVTIE